MSVRNKTTEEIERERLIREHYSPEQQEFIYSMLTHDELAIVDDAIEKFELMSRGADARGKEERASAGRGIEFYFDLARALFVANEMGTDIEEIDNYTPIDLRHYLVLERAWLGAQKHRLEEKLGREMSEQEFIRYCAERNIPRLFRTLYFYHFQKKMSREE
ncbi:hypothetical protein D6817_04030 [Candidatus Pacearchaeota archaeon]|nr:MAG: hypothetical protein D6817_04030 [Candidatus Pacearchaeota archaeon]